MAAADAARDSGDLDAAIDCYALVTRRFPLDAAAWVQLGNMCKDRGRYERAEEAYIRAAELRPDDADIPLQHGHMAKLRGRLHEALRYYEHSLTLGDPSGHATRELAALGIKHRDSVRHDLPEGAAVVHRRLIAALGQRRS